MAYSRLAAVVAMMGLCRMPAGFLKRIGLRTGEQDETEGNEGLKIYS